MQFFLPIYVRSLWNFHHFNLLIRNVDYMFNWSYFFMDDARYDGNSFALVNSPCGNGRPLQETVHLWKQTKTSVELVGNRPNFACICSVYHLFFSRPQFPSNVIFTSWFLFIFDQDLNIIIISLFNLSGSGAAKPQKCFFFFFFFFFWVKNHGFLFSSRRQS